jgi:metallo-beta-lactamase family protein
LTFVGAAGTVTGSKHLVSIDGHHLFVDCGLFQGPRDVEALNLAPLPVPAAEMEAVVITHGHLDHVGYLPRLVRDGYHGPIYCTPATADVMEIVLEDAAHIQSHMHDRGFHHERSHSLAPFFTSEDVSATLRQAKTVALETDFTVCGATYGDREHPPDSLAELRATLLAGIERGGPIIMPTFAVERSQDMLFAIGRLQKTDAQIARLPVHLDSPMAIKVDGVFAKHNHLNAPAIVIASSGMATGGRILYHLYRNLENPNATIVFPGYQGQGTLGRIIINGATSVRLFGDQLTVRAAIAHLSGFSAHAGQDELLRWLQTLGSTTAKIYLVHADPPSAQSFAAILKQHGFAATIAQRGMTVTL